MVIHDTIDGVVIVLQVDPVLDGAKIAAEVKVTGGLDGGEDSFPDGWRDGGHG